MIGVIHVIHVIRSVTPVIRSIMQTPSREVGEARIHNNTIRVSIHEQCKMSGEGTLKDNELGSIFLNGRRTCSLGLGCETINAEHVTTRGNVNKKD